MDNAEGEDRGFSLRALGGGIYTPAALFGIGKGAITPALVLTSLHLGASTAQAGLIAGLAGLGNVLADIPAGQLVVRVGERRAMHLAIVLLLAAMGTCIYVENLWFFGLAAFATGSSAAVWQLARQLYITEVVPYAYRARALSLLGGSTRTGMLLGPFLAAGSIVVVGEAGPYWICAAVSVAASACLIAFGADVPEHAATADDPSLKGLLTVIRLHHSRLRTLGTAALLVGATRSSRQLILPLWAHANGASATTASIIFGISSAADILLFYPGGMAMDRWGRRPVAVLALGLLAVAHIILPLTHDMITISLVAMLMGIGNGFSAGLLLVISADAAPPGATGQFLAAFRVIADAGSLASPVLLAGLIAFGSLTVASVALGGVAWLAAAALHRWVPRVPPSRGAHQS